MKIFFLYLARIMLAVISSISLYALIIVLAVIYWVPSWMLTGVMSVEVLKIAVVILLLLIVKQTYSIYREDKELKNTEKIALSLESHYDFLLFNSAINHYFSGNNVLKEVAILQLEKLKSKGKFLDEIGKFLG